jgi:hypothetical protein
MPQIPAFEPNSVPQPAAQARIDPAALAAPYAATAQAGTALANVADKWGAVYAQARQQQLSSKLISNGTNQLNDLSFQLSKLPDSQAALSQFQTQADAIKTQLLAQTSDPEVAAHVDGQLSQYSDMMAERTRHNAFGVESSAHLADLQGNQLPGYASTIANAQTPQERDFAVNQIRDNLDSAASAGWITPDAAVVLRSKTLHDAVRQRASSDPIGAQSLLNSLQPQMTSGDFANVDEQLKTLVPRRQAEDAAASVWTGGGQSASPLTLDNNIGNIRATNVAWDGKGEPANGFETFATPELGARAALQNIRTQERKNGGSITLSDLIGKWAPPSENNTSAYVSDVSSRTGIAPDQTLNTGDAGQMQQLLAAINQHEKGRRTITDDQLNTGIASVLGGAPLPATQSDLQTQLQDVRAKTADLPVWAQEHAEFTLLRHVHDTMAVTAGQRGDLERNLANLETAYLQGETGQDPPEGDIRSLLPPDKAQDALDKLTIARQAGDLFAGVRYATPQQEQDALAALATPGSLAAGKVTVRNHQVVPPVGGDIEPSSETPDNMQLRDRALGLLVQKIREKHQALDDDPAGYAATQPDVSSAYAAVDPNQPETRQTAIAKSLGLQAHFGVPPQNQRVLTNSQVAGIVQGLKSQDPATVDIGKELDNLKQQYGDYWPQAFGDLVQVGKLSPDWQVVANMTAPEQAAARSDMVRTLQTIAQPGGLEKMEKSVPATDKSTIDKNLPGDLAPFRSTLMVPGLADNMGVYQAVQESVRALAYSNVLKGTAGGEQALADAVNAVVGARYDLPSATSGPFATLRTPKGQMAQAQALATWMQTRLTGADIKPPARGDDNLTADQNADVVADAARRNGQWVVTPKDDGAQLVTTLRDGSRVPVIRRDGTPVMFHFSSLADPGTVAAPVQVDQTSPTLLGGVLQ